jgi:protein kinase C substrate 80K-H
LEDDSEDAYDDREDEDDDDDDDDVDRHRRSHSRHSYGDDYDKNKRPTESRKPTSDDDEDDKMPDYDENTKFLISAADEARREYNNFDAKFRDIESEINELKKVLDQDLGLNSEYFPLLQKCFDYTDREYTYSLCPFDRASQRSKSGGVETSLGRWGTWAGPSDFKYAVMKYEHGQNCWNGPDRSAKVHVQCGTTNELVSVTEPNRCEYRYVFNTPAACSQPPEQSDSHPSTHVPPRTEL